MPMVRWLALAACLAVAGCASGPPDQSPSDQVPGATTTTSAGPGGSVRPPDQSPAGPTDPGPTDQLPVETPATTVSPGGAVPPPVAAPAGVVWDGTQVAEGTLFLDSLIATDRAWVVTAREVEDPAAPSTTVSRLFLSEDGVAWDAISFPTSAPRTAVQSIAHGPAGFVAVGGVGVNCSGLACSGGYGVAWVSADGRTWEQVQVPEFQGAVRVSLDDLQVIGDTYVAVGVDERDGRDWVVAVWTSTDGRSWRRATTFDDPAWPLHDPAIFRVGERLIVTAGAARCSDPFRNGSYGFALGIWSTERRMWASDDGSTWSEVDLVGAGLVEAPPEDLCERSDYATNDYGANGTATPLLDALLWTNLTSDEFHLSADGGDTWAALGSDIFPESLGTTPLIAGDTEGFVAVQVGRAHGVVEFAVARSSDGTTWEDWSPDASRLTGVLPEGTRVRDSLIASRGDAMLIVGEAARTRVDNSTDFLGLIALVSQAGMTDDRRCPAPGPGASCPQADLVGADLAGMDLRGIDLRGADLTGADLSHAILDGADLDGASLRQVDLAGLSAIDARFTHSTIGSNSMDGADFTDADLRYVEWGLLTEVTASARFTGADLSGGNNVPTMVLRSEPASVEEARMQAPLLGELQDMSGIRAIGASFSSVSLDGGSFVGADLTRARLTTSAIATDFTDAVLSGVDFLGAELTDALFAGAALDGISWAGVTCPDGFEPGFESNATCVGHFIDR